MSEELCELGIIGLTSSGQSLAAHHASNKVRVCVCDEEASFVPQVIKEYRTQTEKVENDMIGVDPDSAPASRCMLPSNNVDELVARLSTPRKIIIFGTHGDDVKFERMYWNKLSSQLTAGDTVVRWGKEDDAQDRNITFYNDSIVGNLSKLQANPKGIHLMEMIRVDRDRIMVNEGSSPELFLVGGPTEGYNQLVEPFVSSMVKVAHAGNDAGSVHYAQMIQRAIENGVMQAYAEASDVFRSAGYENIEIGRSMNKWGESNGKMASYLTRATGKIFYKRDDIAKSGYVVDHIVDSIELNASDPWIAMEALKLAIPAPTVNATLQTRFWSVMKDERVEASHILKVLPGNDTPSVMRDQISEDMQYALYCSMLVIVAECLAIFQAASDVESWDANLNECIQLWNQDGSILESTVLSDVYSALDSADGEMTNLLTLPDIASELEGAHMPWRRIVSLSSACAVPIPVLSSSLTFYDSYRVQKMPIGLIKAQRDYFNACGYDKFSHQGQQGSFTTCWVKEHTAIKRRKERSSSGASKRRKRKSEA